MIVEFNGNPINSNCLLYFYASWNSSCNVHQDALRWLEMEYNDLLIIKVNTTKYNSMKQKYNIKRIPTYIYIEKNEIKAKIDGYINQYTLGKWLKENRS